MLKTLLSSIVMVFLCNNTTFAQLFTESSASLGVTHQYIDSNLMGGGAAIFDFNNDGWEDLYITGGDGRDQLFQNDQTGSFNEIGIAAGLSLTSTILTNGVIAGDINKDGFKDLFVTTSREHSNILFLNNGDNTFTDISTSAGITDTTWSMTASFGDFNSDGNIDIYCGNYAKYLTAPFYMSIFGGLQNNLYLNNGDNTFTDVSIPYSMVNTGSALATTFTDFDNDSDMDVIVGNDFGTLYGGNTLYRNEYPTANFTNIGSSSGIMEEISSMGIAIGDFDEDLDLDYYISNMMENIHHVNNFNGTFTEDAANAGIEDTNFVSWGTFYFDYDNDTYLDLFVASGGIMGLALPERNVLYQNQQNGTFTDVSLSEGIEDTLRSRGAIYGDLDNDGDLDMLVVNTEPDLISGQNVSLYKNNTDSTNNWIKIDLTGTLSNIDAYGAHIRITSNGRSWMREIDGGSSYLSHNSSIAHFGLGNYTSVDSIIITWPNGTIQEVLNPVINQLHEITEIDVTGTIELDKENIKLYPNPVKNELSISIPKSMKLNNYEIVALDGKRIQKGVLSLNQIQTISVGQIESGMYTIRLNGINTSVSRKITIIR